MYEGRIKPKAFGKDGEKPVLREVRWSDLVARLEASRDFRDTDFKPCEAGFASFTSLRPTDEKSAEGENNRAVNHDVLKHGKSRTVGQPSAATDAAKDDREEL